MREFAENDRRAKGDGAGSAGQRVYFIALMILFQLLSKGDLAVLSIMVDDVKRDLAISDFQFSAAQSLAAMIFYAIGGLALGGLADRHARNRILYLGVTIWSVASAACGLATNFVQLFVARIFVGFGEASLSPCFGSLASDLFSPKRLLTVMSVFSASAVVGGGLALALGGLLLDWITASHPFHATIMGSLAPWRVVVLLMSLPGILFAFLALFLREPAGRGAARREDAGWTQYRHYVRSHLGLFVKVIIGFSLLSLVNQAMLSWGPAYARRVLGLSAGEVGSVIGQVTIFGGVGGTLLAGLLTDYLYGKGHRDACLWLAALGAIIAAPLAVIGLLANSSIAFFAVAAVVQCLVYSHIGPAFGFIQLITPPHARGKSTGLLLLVLIFAALGFGPMIVAGLTDFAFRSDLAVGKSLAIVIGACLPLAAFLLLSARRDFRRWSDGQAAVPVPGAAVPAGFGDAARASL